MAIRPHILSKSAEGNIAVEMALVLPLMTMLLGGIYQYASGVAQTMSLTRAARAAAQYAMENPSDTTGIQNAAQNAGNLTAANLSVTTTTYCMCSDGTSVSCSGTCAADTNPEQYVSVTITQPYTPPLHYNGMSTPSTLRGSAVMRVR